MALEADAVCYVDTSALIKRYVREAGSDEFDEFSREPSYDRILCPLQMVEFTSTLQRRIRMGAMDRHQVAGARHRLLADLAAGGWRLVGFETDVFSKATALLTELGVAVATLDVLHLACALQSNARHFATADRQLATAAHKAGLAVRIF